MSESESPKSEAYEVGYGKPPKHSQFKPGQSGNKKGRPKRPPRAMIPSQMYKDVLRVMEMQMRVKTPGGDATLTFAEATIFAIATGAIKGNPRLLDRWISMQEFALRENLRANPEFELLDTLEQHIIMKGFSVTEGTRDMLKHVAKRSRRTF